MNQLLATITEITISDDLALVRLTCENEDFFSLVIHNKDAYTKVGSSVYMVFKEMEVSIGKNLNAGISIKNRFKSTIKSIQKGHLLSELTLNFKGHSIVAIITTDACERLGLSVGEEVEALVKTNDLMLMQYP